MEFPSFSSGFGGGHCIGVDPYYLAQCAQRYGYNPEIILAGRRMNDGMGDYVANQVVETNVEEGDSGVEFECLDFRFHFQGELSGCA